MGMDMMDIGQIRDKDKTFEEKSSDYQIHLLSRWALQGGKFLPLTIFINFVTELL